MNFALITESPGWLVVLCILAGAGYSFFLYRNEQLLQEVRPWLRWLMAALRFVVVTLLAFLLLTPLIQSITRQVEKPIVIIAQDNSQSILTGADSAFLENYPQQIGDLISELERDFEVRTFSFGDNVSDNISFEFNDKQTSISSLFDELGLRFQNRNVGAMILATDGLYNNGSNPLYSGNHLKAPVYSLALGDTLVRRDVLISKVNYNRVAFLGNIIQMEVSADARECAGEKTLLTIQQDSVEIFRKEISITGNKFHVQVPAYFDAKRKGINHYRIRVSVLPAEISKQNNVADVFIDVTEKKQKVLLLAAAPHPDIAAIKAVMESSFNYEIRMQYSNEFDGKLSDINLVMLHQIPARGSNSSLLLQKFQNSEVPVFYILGSQSDINAFNQLRTGINIVNSAQRINEVQAVPANDFSLFSINDELKNFVSSLPPLKCPFGMYQSTAGNYVLLYQQIGNVKTEQPLLLFNQSEGRKTGILAGEGFWKWKLKEFEKSGNFNFTSELMMKIVQFLSVKDVKSPFRVLYKNNFNENEPLIFNAELFNDAGEMVNEPDVKMVIRNEKNNAFEFIFSKSGKAYTLNAGFLPVGKYSFRSETKLGDKLHAFTGEFVISPLQAELTETTADHALLNALAAKTGGKVVYPQQMNQLSDLIKSREDVKPVIYTEKKLKDLINLKWFFFVLMGLLSMEWFLRKRSGAY